MSWSVSEQYILSAMIITRRRTVIVLALLLLITVLLYTEHPSVRALKEAGVLLRLVDSERTLIGMTDIRSIDHTRGDKESPVVLIEYSDFGCLMCAAMQENLDRLVREESVLLVSRHLYPYTGGAAFERAVAAECVAKHAGEDAYFQFARYVYANQDATAVALRDQAVSLGMQSSEYQDCIQDDAGIRKRILQDSEEGWHLGARGTPYIVVVYGGKPVGISYANEYSRFLERIRMLIAAEKNSR